MELNYINFFSQFENEYETLKRSSSDILQLSPLMIILIDKKLKVINNWLKKYEFESTQHEIYFFKELKPSLVAKLIFYKSLLKITSTLPPTKKDKKKHFQKALDKINEYTVNNKEFYEYHRVKSTYKDRDYFTRQAEIDLLKEDSWVINYDYRYCTSHEYNLAVIISNDMLSQYLESKLDELNGKLSFQTSSQSPLNWTGSKVDLVELIYALQQSRVINAGNMDVKELAVHFGKLFNVEIDDSIYRTYSDIKARKTIRTKFLNALSENLNLKLDEEDF